MSDELHILSFETFKKCLFLSAFSFARGLVKISTGSPTALQDRNSVLLPEIAVLP